jgi:RNA polymerase sigma factor (sigma-70 family)
MIFGLHGIPGVLVRDLWDTHRPRLLSFVRGHLPREIQGAQDEEDIVDDVFLLVLGHIDRFQHRSRKETFAYLKVIAVHRINDHLRQVRRASDYSAQFTAPAQSTEEPCAPAERQDDLRRLHEAMKLLTPAQAEEVDRMLASTAAPGGGDEANLTQAERALRARARRALRDEMLGPDAE